MAIGQIMKFSGVGGSRSTTPSDQELGWTDGKGEPP